MNEIGQWFLGVVQALEKRLRLAWILTLGLGALLWLDRVYREEVNLGDYGRPAAQVIVALAVATILVVAAITLGPICWRGLRAFIHESLNPFEQELREEAERKQREWEQLYAEAEAENRDIDLMFNLNRWFHQLPENCLRYLCSIYRYKEDDLWAWPSDPSIRTLVERRFLDEAPGSYSQQHHYIVPERTKAMLTNKGEAIERISGIERRPWKDWRRIL